MCSVGFPTITVLFFFLVAGVVGRGTDFAWEGWLIRLVRVVMCSFSGSSEVSATRVDETNLDVDKSLEMRDI